MNNPTPPKTNTSDPEHAEPGIVAQNIPSSVGGDNEADAVVNSDVAEAPAVDSGLPAQEDLQQDGQGKLDLPEDDMDKQAAANQKADVPGDSLHDQLQDLSHNDAAADAAADDSVVHYDDEEDEAVNKAEDKDMLDDRPADGDERDYDDAKKWEV
jgi:hypothetical protein